MIKKLNSFLHLVMWRFIWKKVREQIRRKGGSIQFDDGTWLVHQSDKFRSFCYNEAYKEFKRNDT